MKFSDNFDAILINKDDFGSVDSGWVNLLCTFTDRIISFEEYQQGKEMHIIYSIEYNHEYCITKVYIHDVGEFYLRTIGYDDALDFGRWFIYAKSGYTQQLPTMFLKNYTLPSLEDKPDEN